MEYLHKEIKNFIESKKDNLSIQLYTIQDISDTLELCGYKLEDQETNGFQVDFWITFINENKNKIILSGSLWYGNYNLSKE